MFIKEAKYITEENTCSSLSLSDPVRNLWCLYRTPWLKTTCQGNKRPQWIIKSSSKASLRPEWVIRILWQLQECPSICILYVFQYSLVLTWSFLFTTTIMGHSWFYSFWFSSFCGWIPLFSKTLIPGFISWVSLSNSSLLLVLNFAPV